MKKLENQGDVAYHEAVASLFSEQIAPIEVIKWKDIYENMEGCIDQCRGGRPRSRKRRLEALLTERNGAVIEDVPDPDCFA